MTSLDLARTRKSKRESNGGDLLRLDAKGRVRMSHGSSAQSTLTAAKFWSRKQFKGCNALKRKINPTRIPIEEKESYRWLENLRQSSRLLEAPQRCVHIGDRESDIYELFCTAHEEGTHFLVRTCVDRLAGEGGHTVAAAMKRPDGKGTQTAAASQRRAC
jgi:hypothetical protein